MIILVRHGEAEHHIRKLTGGWTDSALTENGCQQLRLLAACLKNDFAGHHPPLVVSSDLMRASKGAQLIADALGAEPVQTYTFLREKNNGKAAGLTQEEAQKFHHPPVTGRELDHVNYEGGETRRDFFTRTASGFQKLLAETGEQDLVIVSHKGTIQNMLFFWLGLSIEDVAKRRISFDIRPGSVTVMGMNRWGEHALFALNDTSYLFGRTRFDLFSLPFARDEKTNF